MSEKKQWVRPQLILLGRGTPEESVLLACKHNQATTIIASANSKNQCKAGTAATCNNCDLQRHS